MALLFTLTVCAFLAAAAEAQNSSYCAISTCSTKGINSLCKYSTTVAGAACQPLYPTVSKVSATDITTILKVHNDYRQKVANGLETLGNPGPQPKASNMRKLVWDQELANMAQAWAMQCTFGHDKCRDVSRFQVGQNIYVYMSSGQVTTINWTSAIASWYGEVKSMTSAYVNSYPSSPTGTIGHYTQLVWATTTSVGCAVTSYSSTVLDPTFKYNALYVCNYGPAGNFLNSPVYKTGTPGSACPTGTTNQSGLCA